MASVGLYGQSASVGGVFVVSRAVNQHLYMLDRGQSESHSLARWILGRAVSGGMEGNMTPGIRDVGWQMEGWGGFC